MNDMNLGTNKNYTHIQCWKFIPLKRFIILLFLGWITLVYRPGNSECILIFPRSLLFLCSGRLLRKAFLRYPDSECLPKPMIPPLPIYITTLTTWYICGCTSSLFSTSAIRKTNHTWDSLFPVHLVPKPCLRLNCAHFAKRTNEWWCSFEESCVVRQRAARAGQLTAPTSSPTSVSTSVALESRTLLKAVPLTGREVRLRVDSLGQQGQVGRGSLRTQQLVLVGREW